MDDVVSTFPLLRLPNKAILNTFSVMNPLQILGISLLSKKTKNLAESLKLATKSFDVIVNNRFHVVLSFPMYGLLSLKLYAVWGMGPPRELKTPAYIHCENMRWANSRSVNQLCDHLQFIFHSSITSLSLFSNWERFSVESLCRIIKKVETLSIYSANQENSRTVMSLIQASTLDIWNNSDKCIIPKNVLIQDLDDICAPGVHITLDELLMINARRIEMSCRRLSVKVFNQFLKLWTKGSNPRLEWVDLQFHENSQNAMLLRGLKYQDASRNAERIFKHCGDREPEKVTGGWNIWRFDGTQATITVSDDWVSLFVWHDHCILNLTNP